LYSQQFNTVVQKYKNAEFDVDFESVENVTGKKLKKNQFLLLSSLVIEQL
jgi:hypothetical protein